MVGICWLSQLLYVPMIFAFGTRRPMASEDLGYPSWSAILSYLDYEEPVFNVSNAFTTDDFRDDYADFYTEANRVRSFGWELKRYGEVPWAGVLIGTENQQKKCGAVLLTETNVMTPAACIRSWLIQKIFNVTNILIDFGDILEYDLGLKIDAIFDVPSINWALVDTYHYHKITDVLDTSLTDLKAKEEYFIQIWNPAILEVAPRYRAGAVLPWPPISISYDPQNCALVESLKAQYCNFTNNKTAYADFVSFNMVPLDGTNYTMRDNFNKIIRIEDQQVELTVLLLNCTLKDIHKHISDYLAQRGELKNLVCWCDYPVPADDLLYQIWKDPDQPHFKKSVYHGLIGSPIVFNGRMAGWLVENIAFTSKTSEKPRGTYARTLDEKIIETMFQWVRRTLVKEKQLKEVDLNRPLMAIHDLKLFMPDQGLKVSDLDLIGWAQSGHNRFSELSAASTTLPGHVILCFVLSQCTRMAQG